MPTPSETRLLPYSAQQMYDLVADVGAYPEFLPWCAAARVRKVTAQDDHDVMEADVESRNGGTHRVMGEMVETESVPAVQLRDAGYPVPEGVEFMDRHLMKMGNRDVTGADFRWVLDSTLSNTQAQVFVLSTHLLRTCKTDETTRLQRQSFSCIGAPIHTTMDWQSNGDMPHRREMVRLV